LFFFLEQQNPQTKIYNSFPDDDDDITYQEREFHRRSVFPTSSASQARQEFIDLLRKAHRQGWKPYLKHHIPATRFGRHRR